MIAELEQILDDCEAESLPRSEMDRKIRAWSKESYGEDIIKIILAELNYWKDIDSLAIGSEAVGALSNVLAAINGHEPTHHTDIKKPGD